MFAGSGSGAVYRMREDHRNDPHLRIEEKFDLRFILVSSQNAYSVPP